jgi:tetratricopeptide (TPR) repeat protein
VLSAALRWYAFHDFKVKRPPLPRRLRAASSAVRRDRRRGGDPLAHSLVVQARIFDIAARPDEAAAAAAEACALGPGRWHGEALVALAYARSHQLEGVAALAAADEAIELYRALPHPPDRYLAQALTIAGTEHVAAGRYDDAEPLLREVLRIIQRRWLFNLAWAASLRADAARSLVRLLRLGGRAREAADLGAVSVSAIDLPDALLSGSTRTVANRLRLETAESRSAVGEHDAARALLERAVTSLRRDRPASDGLLTSALSLLWTELVAVGSDESESDAVLAEVLERGYAELRRNPDGSTEGWIRYLIGVTRQLWQAGRKGKSTEIGADPRLLAMVPEMPATVQLYELLAATAYQLSKLERFDDAVPVADAAVGVAHRYGSIEPIALALEQRLEALRGAGRMAEALPSCEELLELAPAIVDAVGLDSVRVFGQAALVLSWNERVDDAESLLDRAIVVAGSLAASNSLAHALLIVALIQRGHLARGAGSSDRAIENYQSALAERRAFNGSPQQAAMLDTQCAAATAALAKLSA